MKFASVAGEIGKMAAGGNEIFPKGISTRVPKKTKTKPNAKKEEKRAEKEFSSINRRSIGH